MTVGSKNILTVVHGKGGRMPTGLLYEGVRSIKLLWKMQEGPRATSCATGITSFWLTALIFCFGWDGGCMVVDYTESLACRMQSWVQIYLSNHMCTIVNSSQVGHNNHLTAAYCFRQQRDCKRKPTCYLTQSKLVCGFFSLAPPGQSVGSSLNHPWEILFVKHVAGLIAVSTCLSASLDFRYEFWLL